MTPIRKSRPVHLARGLAVMLLGIGVLHFVAPKPFDEIIPEEIPGDPRTLTHLSGVAEIGLGAGLLVPRTRRISGALSALLFLAVYPANLNMVRLWWDKPWPMRIVAIARLPLQVPMVTTALKVYRNS